MQTPLPSLSQLLAHPGVGSFLPKELEKSFSLGNYSPSVQAYWIAAWLHQIHPEIQSLPYPVVIIAPTIKWQEEMADFLASWGFQPLFYPEILESDEKNISDPDLQAERMQVLNALIQRPNQLILTTEKALTQSTPSLDHLKKGRLLLKKGQTYSQKQLLEELTQADYQRESLVVQYGQFTPRGGLVDCFPWQGQTPVRIEWLGDEVDSIREFDPIEQMSIRQIDSIEIQLCAPFAETSEGTSNLEAFFSTPPVRIELGTKNDAPLETALEAEEHSFLHGTRGDQVLSENRRKLLIRSLHDWLADGWQVWISCNNEGELQRLREWLNETAELTQWIKNSPGLLHLCINPLPRGFAWAASKISLLTDSEIFGRYQTLRILRKQNKAAERRRPQAIDFNEINLGDYVVHAEHGISLYHGMQDVPGEDNVLHQVLVLGFRDEAKLYVPIEQAYLVSRYVGPGKRHPQLDTLGGTRWDKVKKQAQKAVMDYAAQLLRIHAEREIEKGFAYPTDTAWQREFEDAFLYEETPDQLKAIAETKIDMESERPMDRLICGDVGFGKTEVAIRAIFKAVMSGKQVTFLAPTTVLAHQHCNTLRDRMADYPITIDILSRFRTKAEQQEVIQQASEGNIDIVVGTHRLISKDVSFKNLGLVVIDEEQRFGVQQKEKFKNLFRLVDVLTLSATPIPRTLYMSLMGARDMSLIETPPAHRLPVETSICGYDERLIRNAIERELNRGGQVFFLHNRIETIGTMGAKLKLLLPNARIEIGHGQMDDSELEDVMNRFIQGKADILLCTSIIESGIDIPNANTIIIDRADRFGLADLYQLRGRVGRSSTRAYALLLLPRELMQGDARKRVQAIQQYSQLGSGYKIAMRDLEIRGAGNLLGTAQSGHIAAVGFELYCKLLKKAVQKLRNEIPLEDRDIYISIDFISFQQEKSGEVVTVYHAQIPPTYMAETHWRIMAYRELAELQNLDQLELLKAKWKDRFGPCPETTKLLLLFYRVKLKAQAARIDRLEVKEGKLMMKRNEDYLMIGSRFPRLTEASPKAMLKEIETWIASFVK